MMKWTLLLLLACILLLPHQASQRGVVAHYKFDGEVRVFSAKCPLPTFLKNPRMQPAGSSPSFASSVPGKNLGQAISFVPGGPLLNLGTWSIASQSYTIALWINVPNPTGGPYNILAKQSGTISWNLALVANPPRFRFRAGVSTGGFEEVITSNSVNSNTWYHMVLMFDADNDRIRIYQDGDLDNPDTTQLNAAQTPYENGARVALGTQAGALIDELYFFSYALSDNEITQLYTQNTGYSAPVIQMPNALDVPLGTPAFLNATATSDGHPVTFTWSVSGCTDAIFSDSTGPTTTVKIAGQVFETYTGTLRVKDTVSSLCETGVVDITLAGTPPGYEPSASTLPISNVLVVPLGGVATVNVALTGLPAPSIRWQELVDVAVSGGRRSEWQGVRHPVAAGVDSEWIFERALAAFKRCNSTANVTTLCSEWLNIANQTAAVYTTPVADSSLNGTLIRFVASNAQDTFFSDPITLVVGAPMETDSGDGNDDAAIAIGTVVGSLGACIVLLCCICVLILTLLIIRKSRKTEDFPGIPPDYEMVIFGRYLDPRYRIKSKHERALKLLDELLLADNDCHFVMALINGCKQAEEDALVKALVHVLHGHNRFLNAFERLIEAAVENSKDRSNLFRSNTPGTKFFKTYAVLVGAPYLWANLARFVWELQRDALVIDELVTDEETGSSMSVYGSSDRLNIRSKSHTLMNMGMEIDPSRMDEAADPKTNTLQLWLTAQKIFSAIMRSHSEMPKELAEALQTVSHVVEANFPGEENKALGAFLFLRFICPALLAPHAYGLLEGPPTETAQRQYILLGKVLQNLANNTLPGAKEEYMNRLNEFITSNQDDLQEFYGKVLGADHLESSGCHIPAQVKQNALAEIHNMLVTHRDEVEQELAKCVEEGDPIYKTVEEIVSVGLVPAVKS